MNQRPPRTLALCTLLAGLCTAPALRADWPCWRGPNHDGISPEKGLPAKWDSPPAKLWENPIGSAFSGLACVGDKLYTCGTADKKQVLYCLNADTGETVWKVPFEEEFKDGSGGDGTRATPTFDDGRVYILGARGKLLCCDAATGKEVWSTQFKAQPKWGYAGSVLIEGDLAIATAGGDDGGLVALNKKTGAPVWHTDKAPTGYATPYPFDFDGARYIVGFLGKEALIVEPQTGKAAWQAKWETSYDVNAATPIFSDGRLFLTSGYKTGAGVFKLARTGDKLTGEKVWGPDKLILGKFQTPVLWEGHLYVSDEKALKCVELATGKEKWSEKGTSNGTVVIADGRLVVFTEGGELQIAPLSAEKYAPTAKAQLLNGKCWTVPTLYKGRIYVRNLKQAACYKLTAN